MKFCVQNRLAETRNFCAGASLQKNFPILIKGKALILQFHTKLQGECRILSTIRFASTS
jgi:hypothetical protein